MPRIKSGPVELVLEENFVGRVQITRGGVLDIRSAGKQSARSVREERQRRPGSALGPVMVFVCHGSADEPVAAAFVELMRAALPLDAKSIRCTSVSGYKLPAGTNVDARLRAEVFSSGAFVALLSPRSIQSVYVMFELGARWGAERYLAPVLIGGLPARRVEAPLRALHTVRGDAESDVLQLVGELADHLGLGVEAPDVYLKALRAFTTAARRSRR
jgi:hypothetical protein